MNLSQRSYEPELLDRPGIPFRDIERNMQELEFINKRLGGHQITLDGVEQLIRNQPLPDRPLHILEMGCGGGDNLAAIAHWAREHQIAVRFTGVDLNPECIAYATGKLKNLDVHWVCCDYRDYHPAEPVDIIFNSLFCHHFTDAQLQEVMQWMKAHSRIGFFINDLQRHQLAYHAIKWLTGWFSRSYLVKHDAPLSVARGFIREDWKRIMRNGGFKDYDLQWKWAFRWLLSYRNNNSGYASAL